MKKTFTISLGYSIFNVEEDAYQMFENISRFNKELFSKDGK